MKKNIIFVTIFFGIVGILIVVGIYIIINTDNYIVTNTDDYQEANNKLRFSEECNPEKDICEEETKCIVWSGDIYRCGKILKDGEECKSVFGECDKELSCQKTDEEKCGGSSLEGHQTCYKIWRCI